jgi:hypothetical protein
MQVGPTTGTHIDMFGLNVTGIPAGDLFGYLTASSRAIWGGSKEDWSVLCLTRFVCVSACDSKGKTSRADHPPIVNVMSMISCASLSNPFHILERLRARPCADQIICLMQLRSRRVTDNIAVLLTCLSRRKARVLIAKSPCTVCCCF